MAFFKIAACCVWLQLSLGIITAAGMQMESQFEHCCGLGSNWAGAGLKCETFTGPVAGVATVEQGLCLSAVDICCVRSYHEKQCELGKGDARSGLACVGNNAPGGEYHRDCCEGCKLGILTGSMGQGCAFKKFAFGKPWDPAFLECCHEALPSTTEPIQGTSGLPGSTDPDNLPTPVLDDICELMKGQLCTDICIPSPGSYKCACREGFSLLEDGKTCRQDSVDIRSRFDKTTPQSDQDDGGFRCPEGYRYQAATQVCDDIDECEENLCPDRCENTIGSYRCISGSKRNSDYQVCPPGFEWDNESSTCVDIDECDEQPDLCDKQTQFCLNLQGSFTCHELTGTGPRSCPAGFKYDAKDSVCKDVDECAEGIHGCAEGAEECRNTDGAYECDVSCDPGYTYSTSLGICVDVDECAKEGSRLCPSHESCLNTIGSFECIRKQRTESAVRRPESRTCAAGWKPTGDASSLQCIDVDECEEGLHSCSPNIERCVNLVGSYRCDPATSTTVNTPTEQDSDASITGYTESSDSAEETDEPTCLPGYQYNRNTGQCNDIDECQSSRHNCTGPLLECVNLLASYRCDCKAGYELNITTFECQDVDECRRGLTKCSIGERCINSIGGHQCTPACPMGLQPHPADESLCQDIDECELGLHSCPASSHVCVNTNGSYVCDVAPPCRPGHARDKVSGQCVDIDECAAGPGCREYERCVNLPGTYDCKPLCGSGWLYNPRIRNCQDVDECLLGRHNCPQNTHTCRNTNGSFVCDPVPPCRNGYRRSEPDGECVDVDECTENVHNCLLDRYQYCTNREGSFECVTRYPACDRGYEFSMATRLCQDIDECSSNQHNCDSARNERCVNFLGGYRCDRPTRTVTQQQPACPSGYRYQSQWRRCMDIDECAEGTHNCGRQQCFNQPGTFQCARAPIPVSKTGSSTCQPGARFTRYGCEDINECIEIEDACTSNEECHNTPGSFVCTCKKGFVLDNVTRACVDINECQVQSHDCLPTQRCDNTMGSYTCVRFLNCGTGYTLNAASEICEDDDECALGTHDCGNGYHCRNTAGSYRCERNSRYTVTTVAPRLKFYPIPSTTTRLPIVFRPPLAVPNQIQITCPSGFIAFGNQCLDDDECARGQPCASAQRCINTVGSYVCMPQVLCAPGYKLDSSEQRCVDIDECVDRLHECGPRQTCENRQGGYICNCPTGFIDGPNRDCVDIDECSIFKNTVCSSNSRCENTVGSYRCICEAGFESISDVSCKDVDECQQSPGICQHKCINAWGSYRCACNPGFRLNLDNRSCTDIDECMEFKENNLCIGICQNTPGSYSCQCPSGYRLGTDGRTCQDIDECESGQACRDPNEMCQNTRGHFRCNRIDCPAGYYRDTERKNRCLRTSRYCQTGDLACFQSPSHYSFNFMTFVSMLPIPQSGQLELFTMRGTGQFGSMVRFRMELIDVRAPPGVTRATESCFALRRPAISQAVIVLTKSLQGPQEIEINLSMEIYNADLFAGSAVVKLFIFVSEYEF